MNDADKVDAQADPVSDMTGVAKQRFELPLFKLQEVFRGFVEQGTARATENIEKMKGSSEEISVVLREACWTNAKGAADFGAKIIEISKDNSNAMLEFISQLAGSRSLSEVVNLSTSQSRKGFEVASAQGRELWELAQRVATETSEPIKKSFDRVLHKAA